MVANKEAKNGKIAALLKLCSVVLAMAFGFAANAENPDATRKRFVLFGYEFGRSKASPPTPLIETASRFKDVGIDGLGLYLPSKEMPDGRKLVSPMDDPFAWYYEDFAADAPLYREAFEKAGLRFNFLKTFFWAPRKHIDWDDDASWERVASTMMALAKFAKVAGFKGLCADHEDYHRSSQFDRRKNEPEFDELAKMVRLRGRQVFSGVFEEFPDAELFFYWFLGWRDRHFTCRDTEGGLRDKGELWPAFRSADGFIERREKELASTHRRFATAVWL